MMDNSVNTTTDSGSNPYPANSDQAMKNPLNIVCDVNMNILPSILNEDVDLDATDLSQIKAVSVSLDSSMPNETHAYMGPLDQPVLTNLEPPTLYLVQANQDHSTTNQSTVNYDYEDTLANQVNGFTHTTNLNSVNVNDYMDQHDPMVASFDIPTAYTGDTRLDIMSEIFEANIYPPTPNSLDSNLHPLANSAKANMDPVTPKPKNSSMDPLANPAKASIDPVTPNTQDTNIESEVNPVEAQLDPPTPNPLDAKINHQTNTVEANLNFPPANTGNKNNDLEHILESDEVRTHTPEDNLHVAPKKKRPKTADEKAERYRQKYTLLPPCSCGRKKCFENISEEHRACINKTFWGLTFSERRGWFDAHVTILDVKRRRTGDVLDPKRKHSLLYSLPLQGGVNLNVCKEMFVHTLGLKTDGMVWEFVKSKAGDVSSAIAPVIEGRGHHTPWNKKDRDIIRNHINSYHPVVSHYKLAHAPMRRYLEPGLTITSMWQDFCHKHPKICFELYRQVFESERITFGEPSTDECETCLVYKQHQKEVSSDHDTDECGDCADFKQHERKYVIARDEYQKGVQVGISAYAVDMQKVVLLPKLSTKESFFVSRLVVFNETFARLGDLATGQPDNVILWHETVSGRKASDVASSFIKCIILDSSPKILFWADNCGGQNKNWTLFTAFAQCVNTAWGPEEITIKYLQKGHTYMRADSIHGSIGSKMKAAENIYSFDDFVDICAKSAKAIKPIILSHTDFFEFTGQQRARGGKRTQMPLIGSICEIKFVKGKRSMFYKQNFNEEYTEVDFLKSKFDVNGHFPKRNETMRGILSSKKKAILDLMHVAPPAKKLFWMELPENDAVDDLSEAQ